MIDAPTAITGAIFWCMLLASVLTLGALFRVHIDGRRLLAYEPRRPVPWNVLAPLLVLGPVLLMLLTGPPASEPVETPPTPAITAGDVWLNAGAYLLLAAACMSILTAVYHANVVDLGLPLSWRQLRRDVKIGVVTFLAMLAPVYTIQFFLTVIFEPEHVHPFIEELQTQHTPEVMLAALATVVVAAPLVEETTFRLIFQGWLERREDIALGWRKRVAGPTVGPVGVAPADGESIVDESSEAPTPATDDPAPPEMGVLRVLPYGWAPVLASGALFAMAHVGHGVAPVSLFPLGVALGYVYQRTHRVAPSLVCHALFNGMSMLLLWLQLATQDVAPGQ